MAQKQGLAAVGVVAVLVVAAVGAAATSSDAHAARSTVGFFARTSNGSLAACNMYDWPGYPEDGVICASGTGGSSPRFQEAKVLRNSRVQVCTDSPGCPWTFDDPDPGLTFGVGKSVTVGPFRCRVLQAGVQCTVIATGNGFLINTHEAVRVGSAAPKPRTGSRPAVPVLGHSFFRSAGFGHAHPAYISFGGADENFKMWGVHWRHWGDKRAVGFGKGWWLSSGAKSVSQGHLERQEIVAFDLGSCKGKPAYLKMKWFFPGHGQTFNNTSANQICDL